MHRLEEYRQDIYADYRYFAKYVIDKCNTKIDDVIHEINSVATKQEKEIIIKNTNSNVNTVDKPTLLYEKSVDNYIEECIKELEKVIKKLDG